MMLDDPERALSEEHASNPEPGDYWHEMLCPVCVVVSVSEGKVTICKTTKEVDPDHWTWDISKLETMKVEDFKNGYHMGLFLVFGHMSGLGTIWKL